MIDSIHNNKRLQLLLGLVFGLCFGFLLQRGGVTHYGVIMGQLLLRDWTVVKVIGTAVLVGMLGVYPLRAAGYVRLHKKPGAVGSTVVGALIFGVGFGLLGYCPGTTAGAVGQGSLDALFGGVVGMLLGAGTFAALYDRLNNRFLKRGYFGDITLPELLHIRPLPVVIAAATLIGVLLYALEYLGF